jgi:hypothetical protein
MYCSLKIWEGWHHISITYEVSIMKKVLQGETVSKVSKVADSVVTMYRVTLNHKHGDFALTTKFDLTNVSDDQIKLWAAETLLIRSRKEFKASELPVTELEELFDGKVYDAATFVPKAKRSKEEILNSYMEGASKEELQRIADLVAGKLDK